MFWPNWGEGLDSGTVLDGFGAVTHGHLCVWGDGSSWWHVRCLWLWRLRRLVLAVGPAGATTYPESIPLPDGFYPEGIEVGADHDFYVGSPLNGALYKGGFRFHRR